MHSMCKVNNLRDITHSFNQSVRRPPLILKGDYCNFFWCGSMSDAGNRDSVMSYVRL